MATQTWQTRLRHDSDAEFRLWGSELETKLQAAGLVKTGDTGQINWVTVVRTGVNTDTGYATYYLNDSLHATQPLYIKFFFGTNNTANGYRLRVQTGQGTNGSGTLTGTLSTGMQVNAAYASSTAATSNTTWPSYLCVTEGFVGLAFKIGSTPTTGGFAISRRVDPADGSFDGDAHTVSGFFGASTVNVTAATTGGSNSTTNSGCMPYNFSTLSSGNVPVGFLWEYTAPSRPIFGLLVHPIGEPAVPNSFSAEIFPGLTQTFISVATANNSGAMREAPCAASAILQVGMLWE